MVEDRQRLIARTVEEFERRGSLRLHHEVAGIDPERKVVRVRHGGNEFEQGYDRLLIATGASPVRPEASGLELAGVFHLDVMEDAIAIQEHLREHRAERAVIVGGGYIGLEMAENLRQLGLQVSLVQRGQQLFPSVDVGISVPINEELERNGVDVSFCDAVLQPARAATAE